MATQYVKDKRLSNKERVDLSNNSVIGFFEESLRKNWDLEALTDYQGKTLLYRDVAVYIEKLHILFQCCGLQPGDKVAICGKNCSMWGVTFLSVFTYGAVPVPILADFKSDYIHNIVNHSEAKLLFVGDSVWPGLNPDEMTSIIGAVLINDLSLVLSRSEELTETRNTLNKMFGAKYPSDFGSNDINYYHETDTNSLAILNYTSGTTSFPKGVMIPYRAVRCNLTYACRTLPLQIGSRTVSILPLAHMFGLAFEFMYEILLGCHIHFLTRIPSPKIVFMAFGEFKPNLIISVPLVIEKVVKTTIFPQLKKPRMKIAMQIPFLKNKIKSTIRQKLINAFGGEIIELIIGGAALSKEVEEFLIRIKFPFTVGYGSTECAPLISYIDWSIYKPGSCGQPIDGVEVKILSNNPQKEPGEIIIKGDNVMLGYYKNQVATSEVIDADGWFYSGDIGLMDAEDNIFIKGRSKNMILGSSGQNIYPEEIEDILGNLPYVSECLVVERDGKLTALVFPNMEEVKNDGITEEKIKEIMEQNRTILNSGLPGYEQISRIRILTEGFEKTPKNSIKRFLYQNKK